MESWTVALFVLIIIGALAYIRQQRRVLELRLKESEERNRRTASSLEVEIERLHQAQSSQSSLANVLAHSPDYVFLFDAEGKLSYINRSGMELLGQERLLGASCLTLAQCHPTWAWRIVEEDAIPTAMREGMWRSETTLVNAIGQMIPVSSVVLAHKATPGATGYLSMVARDLTEHKRNIRLDAEKNAAEAANRAKSQFLANMSHEIRTPLSAILGFTELLSIHESDQARKNEWITTIRRNAEHLLELIEDILDLSKVESGQMTIALADIQIKAVVVDVVNTLAAKAAGKHVDLRFEMEGNDELCARVDPKRLRQILINIIGNAVKFTERGSVTIKVTDKAKLGSAENAENILISVSDTGSGMTPSEQARLFEPFRQANQKIAEQFGGSGLGLYLARALARTMSGDVFLAQSEKGRGSTFVISLRASTQTISSQTNNPVLVALDSDEGSLEGHSVLLVEDGPDSRVLLRHFLERAQANVTCAEDAEEGLEKAFAHEYDAIIMDIQLPQMNGYQAMDHLRAGGFRKPIIALTAHAMAGERERCLEKGFDDYLSKPVSYDHLVQTLARHLTRASKPG